MLFRSNFFLPQTRHSTNNLPNAFYDNSLINSNLASSFYYHCGNQFAFYLFNLLSCNMISHNWPSVQNGQFQYPPFNPNTASYTSEDTQASALDLANLAVTSSATTYHFNPDHDINGTGGMIGLTLDQYKAGQRASSAPSVPSAAPVSNKRQLPHDDQV